MLARLMGGRVRRTGGLARPVLWRGMWRVRRGYRGPSYGEAYSGVLEAPARHVYARQVVRRDGGAPCSREGGRGGTVGSCPSVLQPEVRGHVGGGLEDADGGAGGGVGEGVDASAFEGGQESGAVVLAAVQAGV